MYQTELVLSMRRNPTRRKNDYQCSEKCRKRFFWTGFRSLLGALEEVCPGEYRQIRGVRWGSQVELEGRELTPGAVGSFFVECLLRLWAPMVRRNSRDFGLEGPKVTILSALHERNPYAKSGYITKRGSSQNYASLSSLE